MHLTRPFGAAVLLASLLACDSPTRPAPLEPLTAAEITAAAALLRSGGLLDDSVTVLLLVLNEPDKGSLGATSPRPTRRADARLFDQRSELVTDAVVDLDSQHIASVAHRTGAIPTFTSMDGRLARQLLRTDSRWQSGLSRRGLGPADVDAVQMGPGTLDTAWTTPGHRYLRVTAALRAGSPDGAPVEGLTALIDLSARQVVDVIDAEPDPPPLDTMPQVFPANTAPALPERGAGSHSFRLDGHSVTWLGWSFQFALHPREGLVLYQLAHAVGNAQRRSIMARAAVAEMLVPYGDATPAWGFRSVFDVGEFGLGTTAATLIPGRDLPAGATRLDAVLANDRGEPRTLSGVIGIYERDGGLRWRHGARAERSRELVIRFATTVGNYDYGFSWVLSPDGVIAMEIDLTGMMQVKGVHRADPRFGVQVAPHLAAIHHQHFFSFRLDFDVAGPANRLREVEVVALPVDSANPHGTGFTWQSTTLRSEHAASRDAAAARSRFWVVEHADSGGELGGAPGYTFVPGALPDLLAAPGSSLQQRGHFATHPLWVTAFEPDERYPAGDFPGQDSGRSGLLQFQADDALLDGADVVVWYTVGMTHVPRPEEWPIMPVNRLRFEFRPTHFLSRGPWH
ncbi:MAG: histamine oxidase [Gemmatimonadales bacterium]|nr:histamine oxidase [Gemmatimonadales bacterium]